MISKKTTISSIIILTALALVTMPSVLTLGSVYALDFFGSGGGFSNLFSGIGDFVKHSKDLGNNVKKSSDPKEDKASDSSKAAEPQKAAEPKESSTDSNKPCKQDNNEKGTHFYCEGTHHHCKPGPDNPKCVKT
jgi:Sec-independent protein translocase protein TatA